MKINLILPIAAKRFKSTLVLPRSGRHTFGVNRKSLDQFSTPLFAYGAVETALAHIFRASPPVKRGALRGRIKHLAQLGLPGVGRGKGRRVQYSTEHAMQLLVALLIADLGVDPVVIVKLVQAHWKFLLPWIRRATDDEALAGNPVFWTIRPRLMSGAWGNSRHALRTVDWVGAFRRFDYFQKGPDGRPIKRENVSMFLDQDGWLCTRNLSDDVSKLRASLEGPSK
jgi:hypothetical protein